MTDEEKKQELEDAIHSGVSTITTGDKSITYKDTESQLKALEQLKRKARTTSTVTYVNPYFDKGL